MKKIISIILSVAVIISQGITFVASAKEDNTVYDTSVTDMLVFGDDSSENEHNLTEKMSITGIDEKAEAQYKDENGKYAGGGLGDGLSYRQILKPSEDAPKETGFLRFTLKADIARQNYITVRLSGNQYARGNIIRVMMIRQSLTRLPDESIPSLIMDIIKTAIPQRADITMLQ